MGARPTLPRRSGASSESAIAGDHAGRLKHRVGWSPNGRAALQVDARPCWTPLAPSMRMNMLEVVGDADGETLGIHRVMMKEVGPKLVFVVAAHPDRKSTRLNSS